MKGAGPWRMGVGVLTLLAAAWLKGAGAEPAVLDAEGRPWTAVSRAGGIELRSSRGSVLLLPACTAHSPEFGTGRWNWANGGFRVLFPEGQILFPRQEPPLADPAGRCRL